MRLNGGPMKTLKKILGLYAMACFAAAIPAAIVGNYPLAIGCLGVAVLFGFISIGG